MRARGWWVGFAALWLPALVGGCRDGGISDPSRPETRPALTITDPAPNDDAVVRRDHPGHAAAAAQPAPSHVVYVSLAPDSVPGGVTAIISNPRLGLSVSVTMVDGGFDPVPIGAVAGDSIAIEIRRADASVLLDLGRRAPPREPPRVVRTVPPRGKTAVPLNSRMEVVFSEPVLESALPGSVQLYRGDAPVPGTVQVLDGVSAAAVFVPAEPLDPNVTYTLVVREGIPDLDGDELQEETRADFTTGTLEVGPVASLGITPEGGEIRVGAQVQAFATAYDAQNNILTGRAVQWYSDNPSVVRVSSTGLITAVADGATWVVAVIEDYFVATMFFVDENLQSVATVTLSADSITLTPGATFEVRLEGRDAEGQLMWWRPVTWTSSNQNVARVTATTIHAADIAAAANGVAKIVANVEGVTDSVVVTVGDTPPANGLVLAPDTATLLLPATRRLPAFSRNTAGGRSPLTGADVQWESSDPAIVAVDADGDVTAMGAGVATVTARWNGYTAAARVTVLQVAFAQLQSGGYHNCALTPAGVAWCWGGNDVGQSGRPGLIDLLPRTPAIVRQPTPAAVADGFAFGAVGMGLWHSCALSATGTAHCWGYNRVAQLGAGSSDRSWRPLPVSGGRAFVAIEAGRDHSCALTAAGAAYCWGTSATGALGVASPTRSLTPLAVAGGHAFTALALGINHSCGLSSGGTAFCWGDNAGGQLGVGESTTSSATPLPVAGGHSFAALVAGDAHTCGLTTAGAAYCWGWNFDGQMGNGVSFTPSFTPSAVAGGHTFTAIAAGATHSCAVSTSGAAYCWGQSANGRLGNGSLASGIFDTPQPVVGGMAFSRITAGSTHSCGMTTDGTWYCWGGNTDGQLGDGTTNHSGAPVKVLGQP